MTGALCLIASAGILAFILKYRVHIHVTYSSSRGKPRAKAGSVPLVRPATVSGRRAEASHFVTKQSVEAPPTAMTRPVQSPRPIASPQTVQDISGALVNLGCKQAQARKITESICRRYPNATFDQLLKIALQEAA